MDSLQTELNKYCLILRKYNLETKYSFFKNFSEIKASRLITAWNFSVKEIQNREIIKNTSDISESENRIIQNRSQKFEIINPDLYYYLNNKFDVTKLKLDDERAERRFRNILAKRHNLKLKKIILEKNIANSINFYSSIEKETIDINEKFNVVFSINNFKATSFKSPRFENFKVLEGPSMSVERKTVNELIVDNIDYSFVLKPKIVDNLIIETAQIEFNNLTFKTKEICINVIDKKKIKRTKKRKEIVEKIEKLAIPSIICSVLFILFFGSKIRDGFTPVDVLTERIYENEIYEFNGSICRDGTTSHSQGRGTCSWHNGVRYKFYKGEHKLTRQECRNLAEKRSWID